MAGCGLPPHKLLVGEDPEVSKTTQPIAIGLGGPAGLNAKTLLLQMKLILVRRPRNPVGTDRKTSSLLGSFIVPKGECRGEGKPGRGHQWS